MQWHLEPQRTYVPLSTDILELRGRYTQATSYRRAVYIAALLLLAPIAITLVATIYTRCDPCVIGCALSSTVMAFVLVGLVLGWTRT